MTEPAQLREIQRRIKTFAAQHGHPPRIMLLSESEGTLGHARVTSTLAKRIREMGGEVIVASGDIDDTFDFGGTLHELPLVLYDHEGGHTPDGTNYQEDADYQVRRKKALLDMARKFQPDVVAFEFHPLSYKKHRLPDVEALLEYKQETGGKLPFVTIGRDSTAHNVEEKRLLALEQFDHVLLRGWKEIEWQAIEEWEEGGIKPMPPEVHAKTEHLGHILADRPANDNRLPPEEQPVMVFSSGGYQQTDRLFFEMAIEACKYSIFSENPWKIVLSKECPDEVFEAFQKKAKEEGNGKITVTYTYDGNDFASDMANCAVALVRGSYNVTLELASQQKPFVVLPRSLSGFASENENRARFLAENGLAATITEAELKQPDGAKQLAQALQKATQVQPVREFTYENGSQFAARLMQIAMQQNHCLQQEQAEWTARSARQGNAVRECL